MTSSINEWIQHPERLNRDSLYELRTVLARYPYFQAVWLLYLKNLHLLHDSAFGNELRRAAVFVTDRRALFYLIEGDKFAVRKQKEQAVMEEEPGLDRTLQLINNFLAQVPEEKLQPSDGDLSTDYIPYMLRKEELPTQTEGESPTPLSGQQLIDEFIEKSDGGYPLHLSQEEEDDQPYTPPVSQVAEEEEDDEFFTETLAKIYIKQQRYSKAMEIIKKLSLKYPKKSTYFAGQIKKLEQLIINTKSK